jgi:hypothetical protein
MTRRRGVVGGLFLLGIGLAPSPAGGQTAARDTVPGDVCTACHAALPVERLAAQLIPRRHAGLGFTKTHAGRPVAAGFAMDPRKVLGDRPGARSEVYGRATDGTMQATTRPRG